MNTQIRTVAPPARAMASVGQNSPRLAGRVLLASVAVLSGLISSARAATPGFTEDFITGTSSFFSGASIEHVPSGGVGGVGDGYITVTRTKPDHLGAASSGPEFIGNLTADGVTGYSFWLSDVGVDDDLEIHLGVGNSFGNFWLYTAGFAAPENGWGQFSVDFSDPADWVLIRGSGTFAQALATTDRIVIRHDLSPYSWFPDSVAGDLGIDRVTVLPEPGTVALLAIGAVAVVSRRQGYIATKARGHEPDTKGKNH